jgi:hypothetical protein
VENKCKEWKFLKQALKTKSVTAIVTDRFLLNFNSTKVINFLLACNYLYSNELETEALQQ